MQLVAVLFQIQSLQQFGGVAATHLDWTMVPYVRLSFHKHFKDGLKWLVDEPVTIAMSKTEVKELSIEDNFYNRYPKAKEYAKAGNAEVQALVNAAEGNYAQASAKLEGYNAAIAQVMNGDLAAAKKSVANDNSAKADYLRAIIAVKEGNVNSAKAQLNSAISKDASLEAKASAFWLSLLKA